MRALCLAVVLSLLAVTNARDADRPNIVFIMSDDHAAHAIGAYGSRINYYHDPGDHNTRAHYGVRTRTHKLIYFWKKDQWELFDLVNDPFELHNLYGQPGHEELTSTLKNELMRLKRSVHDEDQFANEQIPNGVDGTVERLRGK